VTPISKITTAKWTGGVAQAAEHLLCKCEALSQKKEKRNQYYQKKKKKKKESIVDSKYQSTEAVRT
jgi:hypothetical protein